jgi:hypothetical protein
MKKLMIIAFALLLSCGSAFAQYAYTTSTDASGRKDLVMASKDSIVASKTYTIEYLMAVGQAFKYDWFFKLDSLRGAPKMTIYVEGKLSPYESAWTIVDSLVVGPLKQSDTSFYLVGHTVQYYNYMRLKATTTATAQRSRFSAITLKCWKSQ